MEEKAKIKTSLLTDTTDRSMSISNYIPTKDTEDQVFLLSVSEVNKYLKTDDIRCAGDAWFLRTTIHKNENSTTTYAIYVSKSGTMDNAYLVTAKNGIRPAMWVDLK